MTDDDAGSRVDECVRDVPLILCDLDGNVDESPPLLGFSILMTRAPRPAKRSVAYGPASAVVRSRTVFPSSGPFLSSVM